GGQAAQRVELDLADALAREPQLASDLLERARLRAAEAVAQRDDPAVARGQRAESLQQRVGAELQLDALLRERLVAGHEVAEHRLVRVADGRVEARRRPGGGAH